MCSIGWVPWLAIAAIVIAVVICVTCLAEKWMDQRQEFRMEQLKQTHEINEAVSDD